MKHTAYPKIGQFRDIVRSVCRASDYQGQDENGEPIYDTSALKPMLVFTGTVKLHGTNASICYNPIDGLWVQSRSNIITFEKDNADFAAFVLKNKEKWTDMLRSIHKTFFLNDNKTVSLYGEWAGKGIQKGVGVSQLERKFYTFGLKVSCEDEVSYWVENFEINREDLGMYSINKFQCYEIKIDFNNPQLVQNELITLTEAVEKECPVARYFGVSGLGEGVVWSCNYKGSNYRFKVKGEKHSVSKVKKLASVDVEKIKSITEFVEYSITEPRIDQAIKEVFGEEEPSKQKTGDVLRWIANDIISEEQDTLLENNLSWKDVASKVSAEARRIFFSKVDFI